MEINSIDINYYIIKKVNYKNHFIMNIELANITELINRR